MFNMKSNYNHEINSTFPPFKNTAASYKFYENKKR